MIPTKISTSLTRAFGLSTPIVLAPMAGISGGTLAAAVSSAGGLGLIGGGYGSSSWLATQFELAGDADVGVGFISWSLARNPSLLDLVLDRRPRTLFLSFGDLRSFAPRIKKSGVSLIAQVQTVEGARIAMSEGADVVVAQGTEAGGHGGARSTMALVPAVVDVAGATPVLAAGGIADGRGLAAALMLGAAGALCGTCFYTAVESLAHPNAKAAAVASSGDNTVKGSFFDRVRGHHLWPADWTIRTLDNAMHRRWASDAGLGQELPRLEALYDEAARRGDYGTAAVIVGEAVDLVRAIEPGAQIVDRMARDARNIMRGWASQFG